MLYTSTVEPQLLDVLKRFFSLDEFKNFYLAGGTNLSLRYGHRKSIDIDLFSTFEFENDWLIDTFVKYFPEFSYRSNENPIGVFGFLSGVKIDMVRHHFFKIIDTPIVIDGIRMFGDKDIIAMKIVAILKRGVKKDFWDLAELLDHYSIEDFIEYYKDKYPNNSIPISVPFALSYFEDAEKTDDPISLKGQTWDTIKGRIQYAISTFIKN